MILANLDVTPVTVHLDLGFGGATLVAFPMSEDAKASKVIDARQVLVAVAQCSEKDQYNRKYGRLLAISRAEDNGFVFRFPNKCSNETKLTLLRGLAKNFAGFPY